MRPWKMPEVDLDDLIYAEVDGHPSERQKNQAKKPGFFKFPLYRSTILAYNSSANEIREK